MTANLKTIADVRPSLKGDGWPDRIEIRGEVYAPNDAFAAFNAAAEAEGRPSFGSRACRCRIAAPASAASGAPEPAHQPGARRLHAVRRSDRS